MKNNKATGLLCLVVPLVVLLGSIVPARTLVSTLEHPPPGRWWLGESQPIPGVLVGGLEDPTTLPCRRYARAAVALQGLNTAAGCGFSGEGWHGDFSAHLGWCLSQPGFARAAEARAARKVQLGSCSAALDDQPACVWYAWEAALADEENRWLGCGFEGDRWPVGFLAHRAWCEAQVDYTDVISDVQARQQKLSDCANRPI